MQVPQIWIISSVQTSSFLREFTIVAYAPTAVQITAMLKHTLSQIMLINQPRK